MLSLLAGLALGVVAVFAIQPAYAAMTDSHAAAIVTHLSIRSE
jgi:hypothetical protein